MLVEKYSIYISPQECLEGYFELTKGFISQYGIPLAVYVDRHTIFRSPLEGKLSLEEVMSYNSCKNRKVDGLYGKVHFMEILRKGGHPLWRDYQKVKYYARS